MLLEFLCAVIASLFLLGHRTVTFIARTFRLKDTERHLLVLRTAREVRIGQWGFDPLDRMPKHLCRLIHDPVHPRVVSDTARPHIDRKDRL